MDYWYSSRTKHARRPGLRLVVPRCILYAYHIYSWVYRIFLISFLWPVQLVYSRPLPFWISARSPSPACRICLAPPSMCNTVLRHVLLSPLVDLLVRRAMVNYLQLIPNLSCAMRICGLELNQAKATVITSWSPSDKTSRPSGLRIAVFSYPMAYASNICRLCPRFWPLSSSSSSLWGNHYFYSLLPGLLLLYWGLFDNLFRWNHPHLKRSWDESPNLYTMSLSDQIWLQENLCTCIFYLFAQQPMAVTFPLSGPLAWCWLIS